MSVSKDRIRPAVSPSGSGDDLDLADLTFVCVSNVLDAVFKSTGSDRWWSGAQLAIAELARSGQNFDAGNLLEMVGEPHHPNYIGAVFAAAQRSKAIEQVGCRVAPDGRLLRIWHAPTTRTR